VGLRPANPAAAVQTNVALLRRLLPVGIRVVTAAEGYQLHADRVAVDVSADTGHLAKVKINKAAGVQDHSAVD
jgi:hypothetical protein